MKWAYFCLIAGAIIVWSVVNIMHWNSTGSNISKVNPLVDQTRQTSTLTQEAQALSPISLRIDVEQVSSETAGHSVTRVIYTSDTSKMVPIFAGILITVASVYLIVLVVYMCRKGHVFSRRTQSGNMTDNFESIDSYSALTESSWYYSGQTSARTSEDLLNTSQQSHAIKATMSNSSIGDLPCPKVFRNRPTRPTSAKKHQRVNSRELFP